MTETPTTEAATAAVAHSFFMVDPFEKWTSAWSYVTTNGSMPPWVANIDPIGPVVEWARL
jgi:hypothetical protein